MIENDINEFLVMPPIGFIMFQSKVERLLNIEQFCHYKFI